MTQVCAELLLEETSLGQIVSHGLHSDCELVPALLKLVQGGGILVELVSQSVAHTFVSGRFGSRHRLQVRQLANAADARPSGVSQDADFTRGHLLETLFLVIFFHSL